MGNKIVTEADRKACPWPPLAVASAWAWSVVWPRAARRIPASAPRRAA